MEVLKECATSTPIWSLGFKVGRTRQNNKASEQTANNILVLCFCLSRLPSVPPSLWRQSVVGTKASEVQRDQLNGFSFHWRSLHYIMQPYNTQACSPLMTTQDEFLTHPPLFSMETGPFGNQLLENDYFWMRLCFRRYYSYHQETGWNEGGGLMPLWTPFLQILDVLSHPLWERWDKLL